MKKKKTKINSPLFHYEVTRRKINLHSRACAGATISKTEATISIFIIRVKGLFEEEDRLEQVIDAPSL